MIKSVINKAIPIITRFGGDVWVPMAVRVKCRATMILVKEVIITRSVGAKDISVRVMSILKAPFNEPFPLS
jgi:hypothetical protein